MRFSMNTNNLLDVKNIILKSDTNQLEYPIAKLLRNDDPEKSEKRQAAISDSMKLSAERLSERKKMKIIQNRRLYTEN